MVRPLSEIILAALDVSETTALIIRISRCLFLTFKCLTIRTPSKPSSRFMDHIRAEIHATIPIKSYTVTTLSVSRALGMTSNTGLTKDLTAIVTRLSTPCEDLQPCMAVPLGAVVDLRSSTVTTIG